ncbi:MAG: DUF1786 domain-containing protein [Chloroflexi bacterium]|nr:DUF1786 domain-containing protein [Chloroflexota bacterium]
MKILALDIGTGTQDILLLDTTRTVENAFKMVMPAPTAMAAQKIEAATRRRQSLLLTGVTMGGGPCGWALRKHLEAGLQAYATPDAARTFDDDLERVQNWGMVIVSSDEAAGMKRVARVKLADLDWDALSHAFQAFGLELQVEGAAVAVLDHGAATPGVSDRLFRFQHLRRVVEAKNQLTAFAYFSPEVPEYLTRLRAVAESATIDAPLLLMDTGPAAALGALEDKRVASQGEVIVLNLGNMHTLAFHLQGHAIQGLFEHHTGLMSTEKLDTLLQKLVAGTLTQDQVFNDGGHGCFIVSGNSSMPLIGVTGPRRGIMSPSSLKPYFAVPHGDMMLSGCFGLVRAFAEKMPQWREEIEAALGS